MKPIEVTICDDRGGGIEELRVGGGAGWVSMHVSNYDDRHEILLTPEAAQELIDRLEKQLPAAYAHWRSARPAS